jgi:hypothetical protein
MYRLRVEDAVLVLIRQGSFVPLLHKDEEQRGQHGGGFRADAALVALLQGWAIIAGIFEKPSAATRWLVSWIWVGKAFEHHVAIGRQVNAVIAEAWESHLP